MSNITVHATAVSISGGAILIRGAPGAGKSTLALQLIEMPGSGLGNRVLQAGLISDDQTLLTADGRNIWCSAPPALAGLMEVRGLGILRLKAGKPAALKLIVDLVPARQAPRLPEDNDRTAPLLGMEVPLIRLDQDGRALASRVRTAFLQLRKEVLPR